MVEKTDPESDSPGKFEMPGLSDALDLDGGAGEEGDTFEKEGNDSGMLLFMIAVFAIFAIFAAAIVIVIPVMANAIPPRK